MVPGFDPRDKHVHITLSSGTHWLWEVLNMLQTGKVESVPSVNKQDNMLEAVSRDAYDALPSPRVLDTHLPFDKVPAYMIARRCQIVLSHRNPKDIAVSYHQCIRGLKVYEYRGQWDNYFPMFLDGICEYI
jgi:hypothetical protein